MSVECSEEIINYFSELNLSFSKPQAAHLLDFVSVIITIESKKTIFGIPWNISRGIHRCNRNRFLNNSPFDDVQLKNSRLKNSMKNSVLEANSLKKLCQST